MENKMYCYQCQETANTLACTQIGVCGKKAGTANLQDGLIYVIKALSEVELMIVLDDVQIHQQFH